MWSIQELMSPEKPGSATKTDSTGRDWVIHDKLIRLREWGTDRVYELPSEGTAELVLGSGRDANLKIADASGSISRRHARLSLVDGAWTVIDLSSKNGLRVDGAARDKWVLDACAEITLGSVTLIAESARSVALRGFLSRILGWTTSRIEAVDLALRAIRTAAMKRAPLVLCGDSDLVPTAFAIHRITLGPERPFVSADPRRKQADESVRAARNFQSALAALDAAAGGTLCVLASRVPRDFDEVKRALLSPDARVQLVVCSRKPTQEALVSLAIEIPPLNTRAKEIERVIDEYAADAIAELKAPPGTFRRVDRDWVREHAATTLAEIEKATARLVALRLHDYNVTRAAAQLGMAHVSLARWIGRRRLPPQ
jgi:hypothetical protein